MDEMKKYEEKYIEYLTKLIEYKEIQLKRKAMMRLYMGVFLGFIVSFMIYMLFISEIPNSNREVIYLLVGNATGVFGTIINYYFGDSEGREDAVNFYLDNKNLNKKLSDDIQNIEDIENDCK